MFSLEINFNDGVSSPETLLIRRVRANIGAGHQSHVIIEGSTAALTELEINRQLGAKFFCRALSETSSSFAGNGEFDSFATFDLGEVNVSITSLDSDLAVGEKESLDQAGLRVIKQALNQTSPVYPAIALLGPRPVILSFHEGSSVVVGRGLGSNLRVDSTDVSSRHAVIGFDEGSFWIEDLGSTNGTFVGEKRVAGRVTFNNESVRLGLETMLVGIVSDEELRSIGEQAQSQQAAEPVETQTYPCLLALNEAVKPTRFALSKGQTITMGRDPANDIWLGSGHISRNHLKVALSSEGDLVLEDISSNGTFLDGTSIPLGEPVTLEPKGHLLDFGGEIELAICYSKLDEAKFLGQKPAEVASKDPEPFVSRTGPVPKIDEESSGVFAKLVAQKSAEEQEALGNAVIGAELGSSAYDNFSQEEDFSTEFSENTDISEELFGKQKGSRDFSNYKPQGGLATKILIMSSVMFVICLMIVLFIWFVGSSV